jgi:predicted ribosomally synthesized six-cysteine peptide SCIFF
MKEVRTMREDWTTKHVELIDSPEADLRDVVDCRACASSCQSACKTSCTVANQPCERVASER